MHSHNLWLVLVSKDNHANFMQFTLLAVSEEAETWLPWLSAEAEKPLQLYLELDYSGYHKNLIQ